jgi:cellulose synthase/poly-beta-1,6-N-acetylglucosamine synthase-like glycosyltransferase
LKSEPKTAAVCSRAGVLPYRGKNFFMRIFHMLQRLEYSDFDSQRVETLGAVKVVHGMAAIHRWSCFKEIGGFDDDNLVEDYDLTLRYKEAGYAVTVELLMNAWTEVPLLFKEWWRQRLRWYRGGVETLKSHGWNESTKMEIVQHFWVNFLMLFQWYFLFIFFYMLARGTILMHGFVLIVILLSMFGSLYRLKYLTGRKRGIAYVLRLLVFPEMIYGLMNTINLYHAYYNFFFKKEQAW